MAPAYIAELPQDVFGDRPYRYRRTEAGCLLYSVGSNGIDDEGRQTDGADDFPFPIPPETD